MDQRIESLRANGDISTVTNLKDKRIDKAGAAADAVDDARKALPRYPCANVEDDYRKAVRSRRALALADTF